MYTSIDLFSGPGGLCTGLKATDIFPLIAVEWSDNTVETYKASHNAEVLILGQYLENPADFEHVFERLPIEEFKTLLIHGDIRKVTDQLIDRILNERFGVNTVDLVTGGAPCESFSLAGTRTENDERDNLFLNLERIAKHVNAKMLLFENVKGLLSKPNPEGGTMYDLICEELERENAEGVAFKLASKDKNTVLLKAIDYGVPQARERVFLVGINSRYTNNEDVIFNYPKPTHGPNRMFPYITVEDAIMDLPIVNSKEGDEVTHYAANTNVNQLHRRNFLQFIGGVTVELPRHLNDLQGTINSHIGPGHTEKMLRRFEFIRPGEGMKKAAERLIEAGNKETREQYFPKKLYAARNRRLKLDKPSFTVTSHCLDEMIHPTLNRSITPREAARLQTFPDWYQFRGPYVQFHGSIEQDRYEQIGDAIPPLLGYVLGKQIVQTLESIGRNNENNIGNLTTIS
ncbi:MAG: DNA cytosine methyltransferase [Kurthia gibsonii]